MKHRVFLSPEGFVEMEYHGEILTSENINTIKGAYNLIAKIVDSGREAKLLVNMTDVSSIDPEVLGIRAKALRDGEFTKLADFGANETVSEQIQTIFEKSGTIGKGALFPTREEAVAWLQSQ